MERLSKLYGDSPEVKISLEKPAPVMVEDDEDDNTGTQTGERCT